MESLRANVAGCYNPFFATDVKVFKKDVLVGTLKCSVCPGGKCTANVSGLSAACSGCGSSPGRDCTYDPL